LRSGHAECTKCSTNVLLSIFAIMDSVMAPPLHGCYGKWPAGSEHPRHAGVSPVERALGVASIELFVADAHRLLGRDVEAFIRINIGRSYADPRLVWQVRLEAIIKRLLHQCVSVGEKENLLRP
jgi:hypothetical protein